MEPHNNKDDGFPEHDLATIRGYDVAALNGEIASNRAKVSKLCRAREVWGQEIVKMRRTMDEEIANEKHIARLTASISSAKEEERKIGLYIARLAGYIELLERPLDGTE